MHKTCLYILGRIAYIFNGEVNASQANVLKKALRYFPDVEATLVLRCQYHQL